MAANAVDAFLGNTFISRQDNEPGYHTKKRAQLMHRDSGYASVRIHGLWSPNRLGYMGPTWMVDYGPISLAMTL